MRSRKEKKKEFLPQMCHHVAKQEGLKGLSTILQRLQLWDPAHLFDRVAATDDFMVSRIGPMATILSTVDHFRPSRVTIKSLNYRDKKNEKKSKPYPLAGVGSDNKLYSPIFYA